MTGPRPPADQGARDRAVTVFDRSLVVQAGAGTGKTSLLVERMLTALGSGHLTLDRLAAITFTEKAAGEMRERLALRLEGLRALARGETVPDRARSSGRAYLNLSERGVAPAVLADRAVAALVRLEAATITTLHGFCAEILRSHPIEAGVDPHFSVDTGERFEALLDESWERFVAEELGPRARRGDLWRDLLERIPLPRIRSVARALARFQVPRELLGPGASSGEAASLLRAEAAAIASECEGLLERARGLTPLAERVFSGLHASLALAAGEGLAALRAALDGDESLAELAARRSTLSANRKLSGVSSERFERIAKDGLVLLRDLASIEDAQLEGLLEAVEPFALEARERLLRRGLVSFDALLVLARDLLRDHPRVRRRVKRRYRMLLVDEFQDTDPLQYEIVLFLAEREGAEAREAFEAELEPGRLFVVGDPKQSIYRFRGADYTAYDRAVRRITDQGGELLELTENFRSLPEVLAPINRLFEGPDSAWQESVYQPSYTAVRAYKAAAGPGPRVEVWQIEPEARLGAEPRRRGEGRVLAAEIRRLVDEEGYAFRDVSVLLRAFTSLSPYVRALREWNIPYVVDGGREFMERPEVEHLMASLRALARPADPIALVAQLRSPAGAVPDTELARYAEAGGRWDWRRGVEAGEYPGIARSFETLRLLERETRDLPVDAVVRRVLRRTNLLPLDGAAFEGAQRAANLRKLAGAAAELARDGSLSLGEVLAALDEGRGTDVESDSPLADEATDAVRLFTVHKAKGLENRVVIVPDLARQAGRSRGGLEPPALLARLPSGDLALGLRVDGCRDATRVWRDREERRHDDAESLRVLYVALTRARERLALIASPPAGRAPWLEALEPWNRESGGESAEVTRRVVEPSEAPPAGADPRSEPTDEAVERYREALDLLDKRAGALFLLPSGLAEEREERREQRDEEGEGIAAPPADLARCAGLAAHRLLEIWDRESDAGLREAVGPCSRAVAASEKADPEAVERETREIVESFLASPLAERLRKIDVVGQEVPLLMTRGEGSDRERWRGFIDLLYREPEGALVVADYKTDRDLDDEAAAERYRGQLGLYAEAVRRALSLTALPRAELWLLRHGRVVPLP